MRHSLSRTNQLLDDFTASLKDYVFPQYSETDEQRAMESFTGGAGI